MPQDLTFEPQDLNAPAEAAIVVHNIAPLRAAPDGGSEQTSQAILGDRVIWLAERDDYIQVQMADAYEGWMWRGHVRPLPSCSDADPFIWPLQLESRGESQGKPHMACYVSCDIANLYGRPGAPETLITKLVPGTWCRPCNARLGGVGSEGAGKDALLKVAVPYRATVGNDSDLTIGYLDPRVTTPASERGYQGEFSGEAVCALALRFVGTPYVWGGTTPFGFDCSGFVQRIYSLLNVSLPRDAYVQAASPLGIQLAPDRTTQAGDLVFFCGHNDPRKRGITHVGIALGAERFIHAYGKRGVVVTAFDDPAQRATYTSICTWRHPPISR